MHKDRVAAEKTIATIDYAEYSCGSIPGILN